MTDILNRLIESPSIAKTEIVEDGHGKRTAISMKPRYVFFEKKYKPVKDKDGEISLKLLPPMQQKYLVFDMEDRTQNYSKKSQRALANHRSVTHDTVSPPVLSFRSGCESLCPVMYNSKHNMLCIDGHNHKKPLPCCGFINYVSIMQFKDGTSYININYKIIAYNEKSENLFWLSSDRYSLKLRGENGRTSLVKNGRLVVASADIIYFFHILKKSKIFRSRSDNHPEYIPFLELFDELFFTDTKNLSEQERKECSILCKSAPELANLYRVKRNKNLKQLPWNELDLAQIYALPCSLHPEDELFLEEDDLRGMRNTRANINRHIRKNNTKKATDACFYGVSFPKRFRKLMLKTKPMQFYKKTYQFLADIVEQKGVNKALDYFSIEGDPDIQVLKNTSALEAISLGFKAERILKEIKKKDNFQCRYFIDDALSMRSQLLETGIDINIQEKDIFKYHDLISNLYNTVKKATQSAELDLYRTTDTSSQLPTLTANSYTIRSPKTTYELLDIGSQMNHCVASYMDDYFYRKLEICVVERGGKYIACLEIVRNTIVQAKLSNNRYLTEDKEVLELVKKWAEQNNIKLGSADCGVKQESTGRQKPCEERLALAKEIALEKGFNVLP